MPKKDVISKSAVKKTATKKTATKKPAVKKTATKKVTATKSSVARATRGRTSGPPVPGAGDVIIIDSVKVGSIPREGEILEVIQGEVSVSFLVRWADGRQSLIAPTAGTAQVVPASHRA